MTHDPTHPFFVVGATRSGTTLLRVMLDRHPRVAVPPESHFIPDLWERRHRYGPDGRVHDRSAFLHDLGTDPRFAAWGIPVEQVEQELPDTQGPALSEALAAAFRAYARAQGKERWGDKTPQYLEHLALLDRLFPTAQFVHLVRDGRNVALSVVDMGRLHRHPATAAYHWARTVERGRRLGRQLGERRYVEVRYERLVATPEEELRSLCRFLDLEYDPRMLRHEGALETIPEPKRHLHTRLALPPTRGLRDWRRDMSPRDVVECEVVAGRQLRRLGYDLVSGPPTVGARLRALARLALLPSRLLQRRVARRARRWRGYRAGGPRPER